jgi:class 3 adenylate cyclase
MNSLPSRATTRAPPRTATITVLFCDLVASTERQQHLGDDAADELRRLVFAALYAATAATGGDVVKTTGGGMMVVFRDSVVDAVACASRMHDEVEALGVEPPAYLRVGVSAGESAPEDDDWYGTPVVEAARLCAIADVGQTLATDVVRALLGTRGGHQLRRAGPVVLKGISQPVAVADVLRAPRPAPPTRPAMPKRRGRLWIPAIAILAIAVGGSALVTARSHAQPSRSAASGYTPRVETMACDSSVRALVPAATCGSLRVPENREQPGGRWIRVKFTRYPARRESSASGPVIELATALDAAEIVDDPAQSPVRDDADLIVLGGRGLASSVSSLTCPEFAAIAPDLLRHPENDPPTVARGQAALRTATTAWCASASRSTTTR